ncbi:hypothetical protein BD626DRAFT_183468 [Schizophyllum amplum]|uniref:Uncharacterized protein n=1 Tax=Schizophyllum amplum TaxID=97359 RepID=A0A550C131_9AGAR|nr:hypothetical protein BD626DRAFT_183468 [Auriculariopsis ampla]
MTVGYRVHRGRLPSPSRSATVSIAPRSDTPSHIGRSSSLPLSPSDSLVFSPGPRQRAHHVGSQPDVADHLCAALSASCSRSSSSCSRSSSSCSRTNQARYVIPSTLHYASKPLRWSLQEQSTRPSAVQLLFSSSPCHSRSSRVGRWTLMVMDSHRELGRASGGRRVVLAGRHTESNAPGPDWRDGSHQRCPRCTGWPHWFLVVRRRIRLLKVPDAPKDAVLGDEYEGM